VTSTNFYADIGKNLLFRCPSIFLQQLQGASQRAAQKKL
jgi:hypothetical protein